MASNVLDLLFEDNRSGPTNAVKSIFDPDSLKNLSEQFDSFSDVVDKRSERLRNITKSIENANCTDKLFEGLANASSYLGDTGEYIEKSIKKLSDIKVDLPNLSGNIVEPICFSLNSFFKEMVIVLDLLVKAPLVLLKKIEKLMDKVDNILDGLSSATEGCLLQIIVDAKKAINKTLRSGIIDFDQLLEAMINCSCIFDLVKFIFKKTSCGNASTPEELISCIRNDLLLSPENILNAINNFINDNLISVIRDVFNLIEDAITTIKEILLLPLRELVKLYCRLLNLQVPAPYLMLPIPNNPFLSDPFLCLFSYKETSKDIFGVKLVYRTQSIIDIIKTFQIWTDCVDVLCGSLSDEIRQELQRRNRQLRLDYQYWMKDSVADIYFACIHVENKTNNSINNIKDFSVRDVFTDSKIKKVTNLSDSINIIGKIPEKEIPKKELTEFDKVMQDQNPPELFETIKTANGNALFKTGVENDIIKVMNNLGDDISNDTYYRKLQELNQWTGKYKKSQEYINSNKSIVDKYNKLSTNFTEPDNSNFMDGSVSTRVSDDESYTDDVKVVLPNYYVENDFQEIPACSKPEMIEGESLTEYYSRWYNKCKGK
jgi:hypothetical protein